MIKPGWCGSTGIADPGDPPCPQCSEVEQAELKTIMFDADGDGRCKNCGLTWDMHAIGNWCPDSHLRPQDAKS